MSHERNVRLLHGQAFFALVAVVAAAAGAAMADALRGFGLAQWRKTPAALRKGWRSVSKDDSCAVALRCTPAEEVWRRTPEEMAGGVVMRNL